MTGDRPRRDHQATAVSAFGMILMQARGQSPKSVVALGLPHWLGGTSQQQVRHCRHGINRQAFSR